MHPYEYNKYQVVKPNKESQISVSIYEIPPQKSNYPYHYHLKSEEVFYIISGRRNKKIRPHHNKYDGKTFENQLDSWNTGLCK